MTEAIKQEKEYYWLVSGQLIHHPAGDASAISANNFNTVLTTKEERIASKDLGRAQAGLQQQLHRATPGREVAVVDVILLHMSCMGYMTTEEFFGESAATSISKEMQAAANTKPARRPKKPAVK